MLLSNVPGQCLAAYLYVLQLDRPALAWEYLRRNPAYRRCWTEEVASCRPLALRWGLLALENPDLDARLAQPLWVEPPGNTVRLSRAAEGHRTARFSLWGLPGRRTMTHDGVRLSVRCLLTHRTLRLALSREVEEGVPFVYQLASGETQHVSYLATKIVDDELFHARMPRQRERPPRQVAWTHLRTLLVLDARMAGASHREVAVGLFGARTVMQRWSEDGEVRARVRYLVRRGRALSERGYLRLLGIEGPRPG